MMLANRTLVVFLTFGISFVLTVGLCLAETRTFRKSQPEEGRMVERAVEKGLKERFEPSEIDNPLAIMKEGFFKSASETHVTLKNMKSYTWRDYRLDENCQIFDQGELLEFNQLRSGAIIQLVMVEGMVREIIVLQWPS
jgi:hypothetical protein